MQGIQKREEEVKNRGEEVNQIEQNTNTTQEQIQKSFNEHRLLFEQIVNSSEELFRKMITGSIFEKKRRL